MSWWEGAPLAQPADAPPAESWWAAAPLVSTAGKQPAPPPSNGARFAPVPSADGDPIPAPAPPLRQALANREAWNAAGNSTVGTVGAELARPADRGSPFNVLPFSEDAQGNVSFDSNAGVLGALKRTVTAPADVVAGKFDPMSAEGQARAREAAGLITPVNPAIMAGSRTVPGAMTSTRRGEVAAPPPSAQQLKQAASQGYDAARATGAEYPGQSVASHIGETQRAMEADGFIAETSPKVFSILGKLQNPPDGAVVTISSLDAARKALNRIPPNPFDNTEYAAAQRAIRGIDSYIMGGGDGAGMAASLPMADLPVSATASGAGAANGAWAGGVDPLAEAARLIKDARGNRAAAFRSDRLTGIEDAADLRAAAANSGQNGGNTLRQRLASLLLNDKATRGFSAEELDAIRQVVEGTATANALRRVSNLLGGGGGLGQTGIAALGASAGAVLGGPTGAGLGATIPPLLGATTRSGYNALVGRQLGKVDEMVRQRSPLYQDRLGAQSLGPTITDLLAVPALRGLLSTPQTAAGLLGDYNP